MLFTQPSFCPAKYAMLSGKQPSRRPPTASAVFVVAAASAAAVAVRCKDQGRSRKAEMGE